MDYKLKKIDIQLATVLEELSKRSSSKLYEPDSLKNLDLKERRKVIEIITNHNLAVNEYNGYDSFIEGSKFGLLTEKGKEVLLVIQEIANVKPK